MCSRPRDRHDEAQRKLQNNGAICTGYLTMRYLQDTIHERYEADLAELAAGVLDRAEEVALLNHLASCPTCDAKFEQLASAAKSLLLLVIEIEPPLGFESRFRDRIGSCSSDPGILEKFPSHRMTLHVSGRDNGGRGNRDDAR